MLFRSRLPNTVRMNKSRRLRWAYHLARMEERWNTFKIVTGKSTGKRTSGRPRRRWEGNIGMNLKEIGRNTCYWVDWIQDVDYWRALVNAALNLWVL